MVPRKRSAHFKFLVSRTKLWETQVFMHCIGLGCFIVAFWACPITAILGFSFPFRYLKASRSESQSWRQSPPRLGVGDAGAPGQAGGLCPAPRNSHKTQAWFYCEHRSNYSLHKISCTAILLLNSRKARKWGLTISLYVISAVILLSLIPLPFGGGELIRQPRKIWTCLVLFV